MTFAGEHHQVTGCTVTPRPYVSGERAHPTLCFGGASEAAERVSASEADVQLLGEPLEGIAERIERLRKLSDQVERRHKPLEFGPRITTVVRDTAEEAWRDAEAKVARMAAARDETMVSGNRRTAVGQRRLHQLADRGEVLDGCLWTTPGRFGGGGAGTTWLVGSPGDIATALHGYRKLGVTRYVLSDTPCKDEIARVGDQLPPRLREPLG